MLSIFHKYKQNISKSRLRTVIYFKSLLFSFIIYSIISDIFRFFMNVDPKEIEKFSSHAHQWWDPKGELRTLHEVNPTRVEFIKRHYGDLAHAETIDIGCGGGILSEALAKEGAAVTGIDMAKASLEVAKLHLIESKLDISYLCTTAEEHANSHHGKYDLVTCLELIEHVPDPESIIKSCLSLLKPGGKLFLSTLNRNLKSYLGAVIGAEYILGIIPKGTHHYDKFIRPSELTKWVEAAGGTPEKLMGLHYNPLTHACKLTSNTDINYMLYASKPK